MTCSHEKIKSFNNANGSIKVTCGSCKAAIVDTSGSHEEALSRFLEKHKEKVSPDHMMHNLQDLTEDRTQW